MLGSFAGRVSQSGRRAAEAELRQIPSCYRHITAMRRKRSLLLLAAGLSGIVGCGGNGTAQRCDLPPSISSLSPSNTTAGGPAFTLTVNGASFETQSTVRWNGADQPTNVVNSGQLRAAIPASNIADPGTVKISVHSPNTSVLGDTMPCGGDSNSLAFSINP